MEKREKLSAFVSKLNRLTKQGQIEWKRGKPPGIIESEGGIPYFFKATYMEKNIGVYEEKFRAYNEDTDSHYWASRSVVGFFSEHWEPEYEMADIIGTWDLIDTIKYQIANVDKFLDKILD